MANLRHIVGLALGFGSLLGSALPAEFSAFNTTVAFTSVHVDGATADIPTNCIATTYSAYKDVVAKCPTAVLKDIQVPVGGKILLTGLKAQTVAFMGTIDFAPSPGGRDPFDFLIEFSSSSDTRIVGLVGSVINGHGEDYWDGGGGNKGVKKPKTFRIGHVTNCLIEGITILNAPVHTFSIIGSDTVTLSAIQVDTHLADKPCSQITRNIKRADVSGGLSCGHNSDAFGISSSTNIMITNSVIDNQDDCLAVNSGSNILFVNNICSGGHGASVGSIKDDHVVRGVLISNCIIRRSENGIRIKTYDTATKASVTGVIYKDIILEDIEKFGIVIEQDYRNEGPTGKAGNGVPITGLTLQNIHGSVGGQGQPIYINCGTNSCSDWNFQNIAITGGGIVKAKPSGCIQPPNGVASFCK